MNVRFLSHPTPSLSALGNSTWCVERQRHEGSGRQRQPKAAPTGPLRSGLRTMEPSGRSDEVNPKCRSVKASPSDVAILSRTLVAQKPQKTGANEAQPQVLDSSWIEWTSRQHSTFLTLNYMTDFHHHSDLSSSTSVIPPFPGLG